MEGLGVATSIIAVIQISERVVSACCNYYGSVKGAKKDILEVITVVGGLKTTLEKLHLLIDSAGNPTDRRLPHLAGLDGPLKSCQSELHRIATKLKLNPTSNFNVAGVKVSRVKQLTWP